jgi:hypothetical protein
MTSVFFIKFGRDHKGRAFRYIFCSAIASQKDAAAIPHAKKSIQYGQLRH